MIITLIFAIMLVLGTIAWHKSNSFDIAGLIISFVASPVLLILLIVIIVAHATADNTIQKNKIEYDGLCKRYEIIKSEYEDVSKSDVVADITAWNVKVYNVKYWTENPWTNWFNPKSIADNLEYISIE